MSTEFVNLDSAFFGMAMDSCPELVFVKDDNFRLIYANKSMLGLYAPEARAGVIGSTTIESFSKEEADLFLAKDRETFTTGSTTAVEEIVSYTGQMRTFSVNKTRFVDNEGRIRLLGVATDISELVDRERKLAKANVLLQESEARFRLITQQASDVISLHDADGTTLFMSPAIRTVAGYDPEDITGQTLWAYIVPDDHDILINHQRQLAERAFGVVCTSRFRMLHRTGKPVWVEIAARLTDYDGQRCSIAVSRDVTAQVKLEAQLREASQAAEAATAAKSTFLATMSHEIRTPMTGVLGMVELLRADVDSAQRDRFFDTLEKSAKTLMTVLDDILDFSKIEAGNLKLESIDFDLAALAHNVGDLFGNTASAKGLTLMVQVPPEPIGVNGDPIRVQQIMSNLVSNAIKFTETGGITVTVGPTCATAGRWRIEVIDTGIGIDPATNDVLFSPFVQADRSTTRRFGGTGLGLSISKSLSAAMGGDIGVLAREGGGSVFWLELPLSPAKSVAAVAASRACLDREDDNGTSLRVLVAEDNEVNQLLITALLRRLGHEPICVPNGELAVAEVERGYDVILMDMQMPIMDGIAATRAIRSLPGSMATIPIIALTADAVPERRRFYENIGLTDFLTKPVDVARLKSALDCVILSTKEAAAPPTAAIDAERLGEFRAILGEDTVARLLDLILREASQRPHQIRDLLVAGDTTAVARVAHGLYGAASNIGAIRLAEAARIIELATDKTSAMQALIELEAAALALIETLSPPTPFMTVAKCR